MKYTKIFADEKGETHFKDVEIKLGSVDFAPPAPPINLSSYNPATRYAICVFPSGWFGDWHPTPQKQIYLILLGKVEAQVSDGEVKRARHMGWPRYLDLLHIGQIPGVYVETSWGLTSIAELNGTAYTSRLLRMIGIDNIVFGSDWCSVQIGMEQERQIRLIESLDLTREEKDKILGGNMRRVLNL
jgi:hypothetical protein